MLVSWCSVVFLSLSLSLFYINVLTFLPFILMQVRRGTSVSNEEILGFAKLFNYELTLDNISRLLSWSLWYYHDHFDIWSCIPMHILFCNWYQYYLAIVRDAIMTSLLMLLLPLSGLVYSVCANTWESTLNYSNLVFQMRTYVTCSEKDFRGEIHTFT